MNQQISKLYIILNNNFGKRRIKWNNYKMFKKTQYYSDADLKAFQNQRLAKLIKATYNNVEYYKNLFMQNNIKPEDINVGSLNRIPFLTKKIIAENQDSLLSKNIEGWRIRANSTSGSSGKKTTFYSDSAADYFKNPLNWRAQNWLGLTFGNKELRIWGAMHEVNKHKRIVAKTKNFLSNKVIISSYKLNDQIIKEYIELLNSYKPDHIHAYPSSIYEISKHIIEDKYKVFKPSVIITSGEQLYEWQRDVIKMAFGVDVFSFYGCREVNIVAQECKQHEGLHIMAENILLEVVNEKGENVYDEEGEIVVTDLSNYVFPFIRYKILDRGVLTKKKCSCGRTLPLLKSIHGRTFDIIKLKNGSSIGATFFTHLFREKPGIDDFRVNQNGIDKILVEYITSDENLDISFFKNSIYKQSENQLEVEFKKVEQFNIPDSGKKQFIFSKV